MTRIDFYTQARDRLDVVRKLIQKARDNGRCVLVHTRDDVLARELDAYLWTVPALSFLPHVRCGHASARQTPVLIGPDADDLAAPDVLINLDSESPAFFGRFERLLEVVGQAPEEVAAGRERYRFYKSRGYALNHIDLSRPSP